MFWRRDAYVKEEGTAFLVRVRTAAHREVVEVRFTRAHEVSQTRDGYYVRKVIVAPRSLDRAVLEIWFDRRYRPVRKVVEGGELVPIREWR